MNTTAKWKDDMPAIPWELPEWVTRNIQPEKDIGTGLVFVNIPGTLKEATTQEALQRGTVLAITWKDQAVDGADVVDVLQHYSKHSKLATVHLQNSFLGVGGGKQMARALKTISTLFLQNNSIRDEGVKTIAAALAGNENLTTLALVHENIGHVGARALASSLQQNQHLQHLDLSGNDLTEEGIKDICFALQRNPGSSLQTLKLDSHFGGIVKGEYQGLLRSYKMLYTVGPYHGGVPVPSADAQMDHIEGIDSPVQPASPEKGGNFDNTATAPAV
eukprot:CAMPEP_0179446162 /NCGR_PEP_ID=MMETSP0799-20121207/29574_1 /TAXON_ID=46947 /ORGANISM="Geminigera cryophila, Strain CCMP2564" /LENGTH=274 /DNA_ID=CAMNT_0021234861 /DNA_START=87 /DNA_END=911 /DNA_ORIENTATION=+